MSEPTPPADQPQPQIPDATAPVDPVEVTAVQPEPTVQPQAPLQPEPPAAPQAPAQWPSQAPVPPPAYPDAGGAYPPPAYPGYRVTAAPAPGYAPAPQTSSNAVIALILAIVSWAVCPIIPAIVALVLANSAAKEIDASGGRIQGSGLVTASRIVSWVNIGLWAAVTVIGVFFVVLVAVAGGMGDPNFR